MSIRRNTAVVIIIGLVASTAPLMAAFPGTDIFLPSVGRGPGVAPSEWYTSVWVHNPNSTSVNVTFSLLERNTANLAPLVYNDVIPAGDTRKYDNAVWLMFATETFGALRITAGERVIVSSRIYSQSGADVADSTGQYFAGVPASFAIEAQESTDILGVHQTAPHSESDFRFNFGFVETTGDGLEILVTLKDASGQAVGSRSYSLRQYEARQMALRNEFPSYSGENGRLTVDVLSGTGAAIVFGSSIANESQDPSTVEMTFDENLLAENAGSGSISGITAGEGLTGGGASGSVALHVGAGDGISVTQDTVSVADGGITLDKLAVSGGSSGQVLGTDGSSLSWQEMGLSLPFTAQKAHGDYLMSLDNTNGPALKLTGASGPALVVDSTTNTGVWGRSYHSNSTGVVGQAGVADAWGVHGLNTFKNTEGVLGATHGVYGKADTPAKAGYFLGDVLITGELAAADFENGSIDSADVSFNYAGSSSKGGAATDLSCTGCVAGTDLAADSVDVTHIDASGNSAGRFLMTDGSNLSWQVPSGFALPYSGTGSVNHPNGLFNVTNTGSGFAIGGHATSSAGVYGSSDARGVHGNGSGSGSIGVLGTGTATGVKGTASGIGGTAVHGEVSHASSLGVWGKNTATDSTGVLGGTHGVEGYASGSHKAGYFDGDALVTGDLHVNGVFTAGAKGFRIDHPLAPEDKILNHVSVESSEMLTVYSGNLVLGGDGSGTIRLPNWFEKVNTDFRYQLTAIGAPASGLYVAREISDDSFTIAGGSPGLKVSWQVTAVRHDPFALTNPIPVEEDKAGEERGRLLHPEAR